MLRVCLDYVVILCSDVREAVEEGETEVDFGEKLKYEDSKLYYCREEESDFDILDVEDLEYECYDVTHLLKKCKVGDQANEQ